MAARESIDNINTRYKSEMCLRYLNPGLYGDVNWKELSVKYQIKTPTLREKIFYWCQKDEVIEEMEKIRGTLGKPYFYADKDNRPFTERYQAMLLMLERNKINN